MDSAPGAEQGEMAEMDQASSLDLRENSSESVVVDDVDIGKEMKMKSWEAFVKKLVLGANDSNSGGKAELFAMLEVARIQSANEKRLARKAVWIAETQKEVVKRVQFRNSNISDLLPELVEDYKDKAMLSNMSLTWRDALKLERATFLFHEVFPRLNRHQILSSQDIPICRFVCREWNKSVEYWMQLPVKISSLSLLEVYKLRAPEPDIPNLYPMRLAFDVDFFNIAMFLQSTKQRYPPDGNPFFSRRLRIGCLCAHELEINNLFWTQAERLLDQWGREVWSLEFNFPQPLLPTLDLLQVYETVCKLLKLTPNLRFLAITSNGPMEDTVMLKTNIRQSSLPELVHLQVIVANNIPPAMLKSMLNKYGSTLKHLFAHGTHSNQNAYDGTRLPKLKRLSLMSLRLFLADECKFQVDWPSIEEIDLHYKNFLLVGIPNLFQVINDFGRKLRKLNLKLEEIHGHRESMEPDASATKNLLLDLPNLESFSLAMAFVGANLKTIDFILPMVSLKDLTLCYVRSFKSRCPKGEKCKGNKVGQKRRSAVAGPSNSTKAKAASAADEVSGEIIQFWKYAGRLYESNIWRLLPELRKVTITNVKKLEYPDKDRKNGDGNVKEKVYTREGYRQYVMQRN